MSWRAVAWLLVVGFSAPVFAQSSSSSDAVGLAKSALELYRANRPAEAAELFLQVYALTQRPVQLRNAAKAFEEAGELDRAEGLWVRYREHPEVTEDERSEANAHLELIRERRRRLEITKEREALTEAAQTMKAAAEAARSDAERAREAAERATQPSNTLVAERPGPPLGGVLLIAAGGAMGIASGVFYGLSASKLSSIDDQLSERNRSGQITGTTPARLEQDLSSANTQRNLALAMLVGGIASAAGGTVWWLLSDDEDGVAGQPYAHVQSNAVGLGMTGRF